MDLLVGARRVIVATTHTTKVGEPKILQNCTAPLSADRSVDLIITEAATFRVAHSRLWLAEVAAGFTHKWVADHTAAEYEVLEGETRD